MTETGNERSACELHTFMVTVHGDSPYLGKCLESLKNQTVSARVQLCTSTPSRHIEQTAEKLGFNIIINPRPNTICYESWNFAYEQCETPYVTLAHQDDLYCEKYLECFLAAARHNRDFSIIFSNNGNFIDGKYLNNRPLCLAKRFLLMPFYFSEGIRSEFIKRMCLKIANPICCPSVMFNKAANEDFRFSKDCASHLDWNAWWNMSRRPGAFVYLRDILVYHRLHRQSGTVLTLDNGTAEKDDEQMFRKMGDSAVTARVKAFLHTRMRKSMQ